MLGGRRLQLGLQEAEDRDGQGNPNATERSPHVSEMRTTGAAMKTSATSKRQRTCCCFRGATLSSPLCRRHLSVGGPFSSLLRMKRTFFPSSASPSERVNSQPRYQRSASGVVSSATTGCSGACTGSPASRSNADDGAAGCSGRICLSVQIDCFLWFEKPNVMVSM